MRSLRWNQILTISAVAFVATTHLAFAQASRTWVSGVGDDANPCSRTAPCKTFAGAISKTAAGGEIDVLDPGGYGAVTITKAITIDGGGNYASILVSGTNAINIAAGATDVVTIRNLSINGLGTGIDGIRISSARAVHIENVLVFGFAGKGINAIPSNASSELYVHHSTFRENAGGGITLLPSQPYVVSIDDSTIERNAFGIRAGDRALAMVRNTTVARNTNNGLLAVAAPGQFAQLTVDTCVASSQGAAGVYAEGAGAVVRIAHAMVYGNTTGLNAVSGGQIMSFGNNYNDGNGTNGTPTSVIGES